MEQPNTKGIENEIVAIISEDESQYLDKVCIDIYM